MSKYYRIKQNSIIPSPHNGIYITNGEKWKLLLYPPSYFHLQYSSLPSEKTQKEKIRLFLLRIVT